MYVDTHAHLEMPQFDGDREAVIARARQTGVETIITVGSDLASSRQAIDLASQYEGLFAGVGFHPHEASRFDPAARESLARLARQPKVVAIGEIGLDFYRDLSPREQQLAAFRSQLALGSEMGLPVVVHVRDAFAAAESALRDWAAGFASGDREREKGVLHCFSGDLNFAHFCIDVGLLISFAGPLTYPKADRLAAVARALPLEKILVETDCPFLAPQRFRGKRNEPSFVEETARKLAIIRGVSEEIVAAQTTRNAIRLFGMAAQT